MSDSKPDTTNSRRPRLTLRTIVIIVAAVAALVVFRAAVRHGKVVEQEAARGNDAFLGSFIWWKYAVTHDNLLPPWDPRPGHLSLDRSLTVPSYRITDRWRWEDEHEGDVTLIGPLDEQPNYELTPFLADDRYFYLPYAVTTEEEGMALIEAYRDQVRKGGNFEGHLPAPPGKGTAGSDRFFRCRFNLPTIMAEEGASNRIGDSIAKMVSVMIERPTDRTGDSLWTVNLAHQPILLPYPGRFPVTETFLGALADLEREMRAQYDPPERKAEDSDE